MREKQPPQAVRQGAKVHAIEQGASEDYDKLVLYGDVVHSRDPASGTTAAVDLKWDGSIESLEGAIAIDPLICP
jgi:hypothetical protein